MNDTVLEGLAQRVRSQPHAPAILTRASHSLSYHQLWCKSIQLMQAMSEQGVGVGSIVGLHLQRSSEFVVGVLASWMCGAAFVPMDPSLPDARLRLMRQECQLACVVSIAGSLSWSDGAAIVTPPTQHVDYNVELERVNPPNELAYILFSSGSTGVPKGVEVCHRGLVPVLRAQVKAFGLSTQSRALWLLSPSFDASLSDIGTALLAGAQIHIGDDTLLRNPRELLQILDELGISHLDVPPAVLRLLDVNCAPACLRVLVIGGEVCPADTVRRWAEHCQVFNVYGPTEATICTSMIQCHRQEWQAPFIGQALPGVHYQLLDPDLEKTRIGEVGELYIAGRSLARGYRNLPELTQKRFLWIEGQRFFRTGDALRLHQGGDMEFVGRLDRQFKHGGILVAPEEIESHLRCIPGVVECVVVQEWSGERSVLSAYCVLSEPCQVNQVREALRSRLPAPMVPSRFVLCQNLPRLSNGKLDLQNVCTTSSSTTSTGLASLAQERVALLWEGVLGLESLQSGDDFFALGGDSMAVVQLLVAAQSEGITWSSEQIYQTPRLCDLAATLERAPRSVGRSCAELELWAQLPAGLERKLNLAAKRSEPSRSSPQSTGTILLTGATGFLGAHVLKKLLETTAHKLLLLVRGQDPEQAFFRVSRTLQGYGGRLLPAEAARCTVVLGDLGQQRFGLSRSEWSALGHKVDRIYHCGAAVHLLEPLEQLAAVNIAGCAQLLDLMSTGGRKEMHYASTLSVFVGSEQNAGVFTEGDDIGTLGAIYGGYAQSKWVAERLLRRSAGRAGKISFYRFGLLIGETSLSLGDWLARYVQGRLAGVGDAIGEANEHFSFDLTPISYAAAAMCHLSWHAPAGECFHIANKDAATVRELHESIREIYVKLQSKPEPVSIASNSTNRAVAQLGDCRQQEVYDHLRPCDLFQATKARFVSDNVAAGLAGSRIERPASSSALLKRYLDTLTRELRL